MTHPIVAANGVTEDELILRAQEGDEKAFSEIVRRNEHLVFSFAFKVCRNREYAEETLQDTFVNVFRKLKQFDRKSKLSTWLYTIVTNNCLMKRRRRKLEKESIPIDELELPRAGGAGRSHDEMPTLADTPLHTSMSAELRRLLDEAIQKLPVDYRLVFILRDIEEKSTEETARIMNLSLPAVKSRLRRARIFLREQLQEYMNA